MDRSKIKHFRLIAFCKYLESIGCLMLSFAEPESNIAGGDGGTDDRWNGPLLAPAAKGKMEVSQVQIGDNCLSQLSKIDDDYTMAIYF
jgi:hypothetical protein